MKHISILVPQGDCSVTNIEGTHQIFSQVNSFLEQTGKQPAFKIQLVGLQAETRMKKDLFSVHADVLISEKFHTDLIIIPALQGNMEKQLDLNKEFIPWLIEKYKNGAEIASLCIGSFLLASTGLLHGRECATHWVAANDFRSMFPEVRLVTDKVITDDRGIYSSGGAYSSLNLILYLVEKYAGREIAILCSKIFQIEIDRNSQSPFMIFNVQKDHEDEPIKRAQQFIENNVSDKIAVDQLASLISLSRRNLERRFKKATSNTVIEYIQRVKIEAAKKSLETNRKNVNEVMYECGYSDNKAFRNIFKKITGLSPVDYKNRYNKQAV